MEQGNLRLLIAVEESAYGEALAQGILRHWKEFSITVTTEELPLSAERMAYDAVAATERRIEQLEACDPKVQRFLLGKQECSDRSSDFHCVDPFCGCRELGAFLLRKCGRTVAKPKNKWRSLVQTVGICSAAGGCGTTALAVAAAQQLARRVPVLYLDLQCWPDGESRFSGADNGRFLEEYLYQLFRGEPVLPQEVLRKDISGVFWFHIEGERNPLPRLETEDWKGFLEAVSLFGQPASGRLQQQAVIVMDFPLTDAEQTRGLLQFCDALVLADDGPRGFAKNQRCLEFFKEDIKKPVLRVTNRAERDMLSEGLHHLVIEEDRESFGHARGDCAADRSQKFGTGVRELAEWILQQRYNGADEAHDL